MKRKIIVIDNETCNGCGECIPNCPEGALQVIDGKARLVSDLFCDGLGACLGTCPLGAIAIEEREAEAYDEKKVLANIARQGANTIAAHLRHLQEHGEKEYLQTALAYLRENAIPVPVFENKHGCSSPHKENNGNCPGNRIRDARSAQASAKSFAGNPQSLALPSALQTWPIQLQLLNPQVSFFDDADLLIVADCVPFANADFHRRFLQGKVPIIFCPKLDQTIDQYLTKLTAIFQLHAIRTVTIVRMEVPCCSGVTAIVNRALQNSGKSIPVSEHVVSVSGELLL